MEETFDIVQETIGYKFENFDLLQQAFTRKSYSQENGGQNNEVLEFIGDKALDFVVTKELIEYFGDFTTEKKWNELKLSNPKYFQTKSKEGVFTDIKKDLVQKKSLSAAIDQLGFHKFLFMGKGDEQNNIQEQDSVKEDLFEAIVGAVAIDSNWDIDEISKVVNNMIDLEDYFNNEIELNDYVSMVQEAILEETGKLPEYSYLEDVYGDGYRCILWFDGCKFSGTGTSKIKARFDCAKQAYEYLEKNGYFEESLEDIVGELDPNRSIAQLNELYQKGYIKKPEFRFDEDNKEWICRAILKDKKLSSIGQGTSKKEAQRIATFKLLKYLDDNGI